MCFLFFILTGIFICFFYTGISVAAYAHRLISGFIIIIIIIIIIISPIFYYHLYIFFHDRVSGLVYAHHDLFLRTVFFKNCFFFNGFFFNNWLLLFLQKKHEFFFNNQGVQVNLRAPRLISESTFFIFFPYFVLPLIHFFS